MFTGRAIVINFKLASGARCSVTADRYGMNPQVFAQARANGWDHDRTVAQAISNAMASVIDTYPGDAVETYNVTVV
jgi:hypothetical protein